jgi:hypothetical protein
MKKTVFLGLLAIMLAFGLMGCDDDPVNGSNGKTLTINGIGISGNVTVIVFVQGTFDAVAWGALSNVAVGSNATFTLKDASGSNFLDSYWEGSGTYTISVFNQTPQQIIDSPQAPNISFQTVNLSGTSTTISWSNNGNNTDNGLTINGIGISGNVTVIVFVQGTFDAVAWGTLPNVTTGSNITFTLKEASGQNFLDTDWEGSGIYTIGVFNKTLEQVIQEQEPPYVSFQSVNILNATVTISWSN